VHNETKVAQPVKPHNVTSLAPKVDKNVTEAMMAKIKQVKEVKNKTKEAHLEKKVTAPIAPSKVISGPLNVSKPLVGSNLTRSATLPSVPKLFVNNTLPKTHVQSIVQIAPKIEEPSNNEKDFEFLDQWSQK